MFLRVYRAHLSDHGGVAKVAGGLRQQAVLLLPLFQPVRCSCTTQDRVGLCKEGARQKAAGQDCSAHCNRAMHPCRGCVRVADISPTKVSVDSMCACQQGDPHLPAWCCSAQTSPGAAPGSAAAQGQAGSRPLAQTGRTGIAGIGEQYRCSETGVSYAIFCSVAHLGQACHLIRSLQPDFQL